MFVPMDPRVARMVELMHRANYRRNPTISWRRVLSGAESNREESMGVVNCVCLKPYWGGRPNVRRFDEFWGDVCTVKVRPHFVNVAGHGFFYPFLGVITI